MTAAGTGALPSRILQTFGSIVDTVLPLENQVISLEQITRIKEIVDQNVTSIPASFKKERSFLKIMQTNVQYLIDRKQRSLQAERDDDEQHPLYLPRDFLTTAWKIASTVLSNTKPFDSGSFGDVFVNTYVDTLLVNKKCKSDKDSKEVRQQELDILYSMPSSKWVVAFFGINCQQDIMLEFAPDGSLFEYIVKHCPSQLTPSWRQRIAQDLAHGLSFLADHRILHRDLNLQNVVLTPNNAKIIDFGLAIQLTRDELVDLPLVRVAGTPAYVAPEYCQLGSVRLPASIPGDLWAYGVIVYSMVTKQDFASELCDIHTSVTYDQIRRCFSKCPKKVQQQVTEMIQKAIYSFSQLFQKQPEEAYAVNVLSKIMKRCLVLKPEDRIDIKGLQEEFMEPSGSEKQ